MSEAKPAWKQRILRGIRQGLVIVTYLFVVLSVFDIYKSLILAERQIDLVQFGLNLINAWALAKVILIGEELNLTDRYRDAPLIYPTLLKSCVYSVLLACFKIVEEAVVARFRERSFGESMDAFAGGSWKGVLWLTVVLFVVLIPFFAFGELRRVFGDTIMEVFVRPRNAVRLPPAQYRSA